jgi:hypothetical protein
MFVTKIVPRNNAQWCLSRDDALLRWLLLRFVCSTAAASLLYLQQQQGKVTEPNKCKQTANER